MSEITNVVNNRESHMSPEGVKALTDILVEKSRLYALSLKEFGALNPRDQVRNLCSSETDIEIQIHIPSLLPRWRSSRGTPGSS